MANNGFINQEQEESMRREFICGLYQFGPQYDYNKGIDPSEVYSRQFHQISKTDEEKEIIIEKLVDYFRDDNRKYLEYIENTNKIRITEEGKKYCQEKCIGTGYPTVD